jgi:ribosomal protein S18 acetylase RimI-like enzyme
MGSPATLPRPVDRPPETTTVRPLERADLPSVTALFRETFRTGPPHTEPALAAFFERTLLEQPWRDPEIRPLVAVDEGGLPVGFVAAEVRRMRLGDRSLRFAWAAHTAVAPAARRRAVGLLLMRSLLEGPQDATLGDSGSALMEQMWERLGGQRLDLKAIHWFRVFRPFGVAAHLVGPKRARLRRGVRTLAGQLDGVVASAARVLVAPAAATEAEEPLTPLRMLEGMPRIERRLTLRPAYDEEFLEWLFGELRRVKGRGELVARLVRGGRSRPIGWFIYYLRPGWRSEVLQVAATGERDVGVVLDHLLAHAYSHGSAAVRGRLEPGMLEPLAQRRCLLWYRGGTLVHTRDPDVLAAIESRKALITRLEGDSWLDPLVDVTP